ncbi:MAG TPA: ABC transporter substrate-binding protein, partial [Acidocella sp.]|nr:ABC transporter substrate-binding protein [Acidocella sp.]
MIGSTALAAGTLAKPAIVRAATEISFYYPVAVGGPITKIIDGYAADFGKENPGISVRPIYAGTYQETIVKALIANKSGNPPVTCILLSTDMFSLIDEDAIVPFDELAKSDAEKSWMGKFFPAFMENSRTGGKTWGIPFQRSTIVLYWNKEAFKEAGLDPQNPPKTWPELVAAAKKLTKTVNGKPQYGYGITGGGEFGNTIYRTLPLIWMNGGSILSDDMKEVVVNQKPAVEAVEFYTGMLTKEKVSPPSTLQNDGLALRRLFIAGAIAMYQSGQFDLGAIRKENPSLDFGSMPIPAPVGKKPAALLGGWHFIIPAAASNKDGAARLLAFLAEPGNMGFYTDTFPARTSAMNLPRFQAPELAAFKEMLQYARPAPAHKNW